MIGALLLAAAGAVYFYMPGLSGKNTEIPVRDEVAESGGVSPTPAAPPVSRPPPTAIPSDEDMVSLNNKGVKFVENNDHWRGIYLFSTILERTPGRIEPMINIGAALAELGLVEPAKRYLRQAAVIDRNHPALLANLAILKNAGIVGDDFLEPLKTPGGKR
ncbi:MAG: hypothetical protein P1P81_07140 [Desulfobulbales bacterium]|nr:hypothetical protein [Desulfobulbales bacterium]